MNRRLLVLAWMMPPLIFPRSLQISRTLRAMSARGWKTTVIAVPPDVEPFAAKDLRLESFYQGCYEIRYVEPREEIESSPIWVRLVRKVLRTTNTRDPNWIRRASHALCKQIQYEKPEALISFAQPWINHRVALSVKSQYPQVPWIVHFSDPWVDSPYFKPPDEKSRVTAIKQERAIISAADAVIFTTQETANVVMAKYPDHWARKVHIVTHGYDAKLVGLIESIPRAKKFTIVHTGNLYEKREPFALLRALATLRSELTLDSLIVKFVGHTTQTMQDMVEELGLEDIVVLIPNVPFFESLAIANTADLLLVIDAPAEYSVFLPSKVFDYLSLRRPILALTPHTGASARVLRGLGLPTVDSTDEVGILNMLHESLARWQRGEPATSVPSEDLLQHFEMNEVVLGFEKAVLSGISNREQTCA